MGVSTMAFLPDEPQKLLIPCEGNVVAILDLQGNIEQRISPEGLDNSIIMSIQSNTLSGEREIGILTLDNMFYLFDESFQFLATHKAEIQHFRFAQLQYYGEELLLLALNGTVRAVDLQRVKRWEHHFEGLPNQISSAMIDDQLRVLVSRSASEDSILVLSPEGQAFEPIDIAFGRHVIWFQAMGSTIYTLVESTDTGDVRFAGLDMTGKSQWSRLLPPGEYEVDPIYVPSKKRWLVPSPSGEILVFDQIGNVVDTFSLDIIPTGLICLEINGETLLIIADGETVSAWKMGSLSTPL